MVEFTAIPILIGICCLLVGILIGTGISRARFKLKLRDAQRVIKTELEREREQLSAAVHQHMGSVRQVLTDALEAHDRTTEAVKKQLTRPIDVSRLNLLSSFEAPRLEGGDQQSASSHARESQLDILDQLQQQEPESGSRAEAEPATTEAEPEADASSPEAREDGRSTTAGEASSGQESKEPESRERSSLNGSQAHGSAG